MPKRPDFSKPMELSLPSSAFYLGATLGLLMDEPDTRWLIRLVNGAVVLASSRRKRKPKEYLVLHAGKFEEVDPEKHVHGLLSLARCRTTKTGELAGATTAEERAVVRWLEDLSDKMTRRCFEAPCLRDWLGTHPGYGRDFDYTALYAILDDRLCRQIRDFFKPIPKYTRLTVPEWAEQLQAMPLPGWLIEDLVAPQQEP